MRIGQINNYLNFTRAIPLKTQKTRKNSDPKIKIFSELCNVINGKPTNAYSQEDTQKIKDFFYNILGDCNGNNPILVEKSIEGNYVLLSGKDARDIRFFKEKALENIKEYKKNNGISYQTKIELINRSDDAVKKSVQYKAENGRNGKPESSIVIQQYKGADKKQHIKIQYLSALSYLITPKYKDEGEKEKSYCKFTNAYCDYKEIEI